LEASLPIKKVYTILKTRESQLDVFSVLCCLAEIQLRIKHPTVCHFSVRVPKSIRPSLFFLEKQPAFGLLIRVELSCGNLLVSAISPENLTVEHQHQVAATSEQWREF